MGNGVTRDDVQKNFQLAFLLGLVAMLAVYMSLALPALLAMSSPIPLMPSRVVRAVRKVKRAYPILMRMGSLSLSVLRTPSLIVRRAVPMMTASMTVSLISCLRVWRVRMGAAHFVRRHVLRMMSVLLADIVSYLAMEQAHVYRIPAAVSAQAGQPSVGQSLSVQFQTLKAAALVNEVVVQMA